MNAVNLLAMMFAAQAAATPKSQPTGQLPDDGGFSWLLQQQIPGGDGTLPLGETGPGLAQFVANLPELTLALNPEQQSHAGLAAAPGALSRATAVGPGWSLSELLAAMLDSLSQVLTPEILRGNPQEVPASSLSDMTIGGGDVEVATAAESMSTPGESGGIVPALIAAWDRILDLLNSRLASQTKPNLVAQATPLRPAFAGQGLPAVPWTLRLQAQQLLRDGAAAQLTNATGPAPLLTEPGLTADLPASVQWFKSVGLLGSRPVAVNAGPVQTPVSARLELPDGSTLLIRLSEIGNPQPDAQRSFNVRIEMPGDPATALTATLTIRQVAPPPQAILADTSAMISVVAPTAVDSGDGRVGQTIDGLQAGIVDPQPELPVSGNVKNSGIPTLLSAIDEAQQPSSGFAVDVAAPEGDGNRVTDQLLTGLKSVPILEGEVPVAQSRQSATPPPNGGDWATQLALNQLGSLRQQPVTVTLQQPNDGHSDQLMPTSDRPLGGDLVHAIAAPVSAEAAAPQLMEFVGSRFETAQYGGLEYLEMAERIMERVATARNAGNGLYNAHLDLNPPNLGKMFVNISVRGDAVALQIAVATPVPKEQLKDSLEALRKSLEDEGLYVVELRVVQVNDEQRSGHQQAGHEQQEQGEQQSAVVKTTPSLRRGIKSTPALGFSP